MEMEGDKIVVRRANPPVPHRVDLAADDGSQDMERLIEFVVVLIQGVNIKSKYPIDIVTYLCLCQLNTGWNTLGDLVRCRAWNDPCCPPNPGCCPPCFQGINVRLEQGEPEQNQRGSQSQPQKAKNEPRMSMEE